MTGRFAADTAVSRRSTQTDGTGIETTTYTSDVKAGWDIGGNANGGYLMSIAGRAMADHLGRPPVTLTAHYLRPAAHGPCEVIVSTVRSGRRFATATASLVMTGGGERREIIRLLGTFGFHEPGGPSYSAEGPVDIAGFDECGPRAPSDQGPKPSLMNVLDVRLADEDRGFFEGTPSGVPQMRGWFAFADGSPVDELGLLLAADAFPPAIFNSGVPAAWAPTVELTVHVRGLPAEGPIRCAFRSRFIGDGLMDEEGELWDANGMLVAQSRQLALVPRT